MRIPAKRSVSKIGSIRSHNKHASRLMDMYHSLVRFVLTTFWFYGAVISVYSIVIIFVKMMRIEN